MRPWPLRRLELICGTEPAAVWLAIPFHPPPDGNGFGFGPLEVGERMEWGRGCKEWRGGSLLGELVGAFVADDALVGRGPEEGEVVGSVRVEEAKCRFTELASE